MKYRGVVLADLNTTISIVGEIGYGRVCTIEVATIGMRWAMHLDPKDAREMARHLNAAVELAERPVNTV